MRQTNNPSQIYLNRGGVVNHPYIVVELGRDYWKTAKTTLSVIIKKDIGTMTTPLTNY